MNKKIIVGLVSKKLNGLINSYHVFSVINIFIDELVRELKNNNKVVIHNFATFEMIDIKSKVIKRVSDGKSKITVPSRALRLRLARKIKKYIYGTK